MHDFDTIVIGSGAGGLTAALALARAGQRVAVFEQHYLPGGWCHSFNLGGYRFSPGVHYIGGLGPGGPMRGLYEGLGLADDLVFLELNPDGYDHLQVGTERFDVPAGRERYAEALKRRFPREAAGIDGYLGTCEAIYDELAGGTRARGLRGALTLPWRLRHLLRYGFLTLDRFLDHFTKDPLLRAYLSIQAGDHGMGPAEAPAAMHASVVGHYLDGGWYPMGGARSLPKAYIAQLRKHGGVVKVRTPVDRILFEGTGRSQRVVGVRLGDGTEVRAKAVVSNADPGITYGRLVERDRLPRRLARHLDRTTWSISGLSLFLAAEIDPAEHGLDSGNLWYSHDTDIDAGYRLAHRPELASAGSLPGTFLTVTTLKDRTKHYGKLHTMESFAFVSYEAFRRWEGTPQGERDAAYEHFKQQLTDKMFEVLEHSVPGLRERTVFHELGTPLTNVHYVASTRGNLYGTEKRRGQLGPLGYGVRSPLQGLYLAGASTLGHGVAGATISGVAAACSVLGVSRREVLTGRGNLVTLPADHPGRWPSPWRDKALPEPHDAVA